MRVLETAALDTGQINSWAGKTDIFIYPGFKFLVCDGLITNFHLPKSTLLEGQLIDESIEQKLFSKTQTGISHCPCSNCRLGSGIAPIKEMKSMGIPIGLGVDGSASNDSGNLITEARQAMLMQRVSSGADAMKFRRN